jgi:hypothetical protein
MQAACTSACRLRRFTWGPRPHAAALLVPPEHTSLISLKHYALQFESTLELRRSSPVADVPGSPAAAPASTALRSSKMASHGPTVQTIAHLHLKYSIGQRTPDSHAARREPGAPRCGAVERNSQARAAGTAACQTRTGV